MKNNKEKECNCRCHKNNKTICGDCDCREETTEDCNHFYFSPVCNSCPVDMVALAVKAREEEIKEKIEKKFEYYSIDGNDALVLISNDDNKPTQRPAHEEVRDEILDLITNI